MLKPRPHFSKRLDAFTLVEVLVALIIVGILVMLIMPNMMSVVTRAKMTEAKLQLEHLQVLEKGYFFEHSKYTNDLNELGFVQEKLVTADGSDGHANYRIEVTSAGTSGFIGRATSVVDFDGDGTYNVWEVDQNKTLKEVTPD